MTFIETPEQSELYAPAEAELGYVPNMVRLWANRPDVYAAWQSLNDAVRSHIELRRYELATVAAARRLRSTYCAVAHAKILADTGLSSAELIDFVDEPARVLDEVELAVTEFASLVADDAVAVTPEHIDRLRAVGLGRRRDPRHRAGRGHALLLQQDARRHGGRGRRRVPRHARRRRVERLTVGRPIAQSA